MKVDDYNYALEQHLLYLRLLGGKKQKERNLQKTEIVKAKLLW